jgi:hypothetical protein
MRLSGVGGVMCVPVRWKGVQRAVGVSCVMCVCTVVGMLLRLEWRAVWVKEWQCW